MIRKAKAVWRGTGRGGAVAISQATTFALMNCDGDTLLGFSRLKNECPSG